MAPIMHHIQEIIDYLRVYPAKIYTILQERAVQVMEFHNLAR